MVLPIKRKNCWEKKTRVISCNVDWVWHLRSSIVGPRKATQSPKLKNTLQYVKVCCQLSRNKAQMRSLIRCFILEKLRAGVVEVFLQHYTVTFILGVRKKLLKEDTRVFVRWVESNDVRSLNRSLESVLLNDSNEPIREEFVNHLASQENLKSNVISWYYLQTNYKPG